MIYNLMCAESFRPYEIAQDVLEFLGPRVQELEQLEERYEQAASDALPALTSGDKAAWNRATTAALEAATVRGPLRNAIGLLEADEGRRQYVLGRYRL